jgi:hypothetical protein
MNVMNAVALVKAYRVIDNKIFYDQTIIQLKDVADKATAERIALWQAKRHYFPTHEGWYNHEVGVALYHVKETGEPNV